MSRATLSGLLLLGLELVDAGCGRSPQAEAPASATTAGQTESSTPAPAEGGALAEARKAAAVPAGVDTIYVNDVKAGSRTLVAANVLADPDDEVLKNGNGKAIGLSYLFWNPRSRRIDIRSLNAEANYSGPDIDYLETFEIQRGPVEKRAAVIAAWLGNCVQVDVSDVNGTTTTIGCPSVDYSVPSGKMLLGGSVPDDDSALTIEDGSLRESVAFDTLTSLEFLAGDAAELRQGSAPPRRCTVVNPHGELDQRLQGFTPDGVRYIPFEEITAIRRR